jgi:hypothetical protein
MIDGREQAFQETVDGLTIGAVADVGECGGVR